KLGMTPLKSLGSKNEPKHKPYDNAYFFILFVMLFYSFLALTVFFGYVRSKKLILNVSVCRLNTRICATNVL
uniref:Uncharacterized protein n=1 Tax=Gopherus agassizii TaxID=38772 RepID=A0A452ILR6_9SAUR